MRLIFPTILIAAVVVFGAVAGAADAPTEPAGSVELQVAALNALHDLNLTTEQLKTFRKLATADPAAPTSEPADKGSDAYHAALKSLRDAIVADDPEKAADAEQKVDQLRSDEHLDVATTVPLTDSARAKSGDALKLLSVNQIGGYLSVHGDEVPDAVQTIMDAMDQSRGTTDADFAPIRDEAAGQVATLMKGPTASKEATDVEQSIDELLQHAHGMTDKQFEANRGKLEKSARKIVGNLDAFTALHNWMQREMADLLANPELPAMIDARLAHPQS